MRELDLVKRIRRMAPQSGSTPLVLGIGDDCAILRPRQGEELVFTTDLMVEDVHFRRDGYTALFLKAVELFRNLATARADGSHSKLLYQLGRVDLLIVDDFCMAPMSDAERRDFLEICDTRYQARSTLLTSQLPVASWHAQIGDPTIADSTLDRLVHNAHRIELKGESMRKQRGRKPRKENS